MKAARIVLAVVLVLLMAFCVGYYVYGLTVLEKEPTEDIFRMGVVLLGAIASFAKLFSAMGGRRMSLAECEANYAKKIGDAFAPGTQNASPALRKKLLNAARLYNEDRCKKAVNILFSLLPKCQTRSEHYSVLLFLGLCFSDMNYYGDAIEAYTRMISMSIADSTAYSNLAQIYTNIGEDQKALECYDNAIYFDPENPYAYNNLASYYFKKFEFEPAIENAMKSLELNGNMYQASTLLAIVYSLQDKKAEAEKYFHMAISTGQDPNDLKNAIDYYMAQYADRQKETV